MKKFYCITVSDTCAAPPEVENYLDRCCVGRGGDWWASQDMFDSLNLKKVIPSGEYKGWTYENLLIIDAIEVLELVPCRLGTVRRLYPLGVYMPDFGIEPYYVWRIVDNDEPGGYDCNIAIPQKTYRHIGTDNLDGWVKLADINLGYDYE